MHFKVYLLLCIHLFFIHSSNAFNITTILSQYPCFSTFNRYLSETKVASEINSHQTITVLAVSNDDISRLSKKRHNVLDNLMRVHVVLDYYDVEKFNHLPNETVHMTTLFQTTGLAVRQQGFLKASVSKSGGSVVIGSATRGFPLGANLVNSIASEPYNISVLHISSVIIPVGMNCPVVSYSNSSPPVEPPSHRRKTTLPPTPAKPPANTPKKSPPRCSCPHQGAPNSAPSPRVSPHVGAPKSAPSPQVSPHVGAPKSAPSPQVSPNEGAPKTAPSPPVLPHEGATKSPPSKDSAEAPTSAKSTPNSKDTLAGPPLELADAPASPPPKPADNDSTGSITSASNLGAVTTIVLSSILLIIQT